MKTKKEKIKNIYNNIIGSIVKTMKKRHTTTQPKNNTFETKKPWAQKEGKKEIIERMNTKERKK